MKFAREFPALFRIKGCSRMLAYVSRNPTFSSRYGRRRYPIRASRFAHLRRGRGIDPLFDEGDFLRHGGPIPGVFRADSAHHFH